MMALGSIGAGLGQTPMSPLAVTGVILDPSDAGVSGAKVVLRRSDGGEPVSMTADAMGGFRFDGVRAGRYTLCVEQDGFKPATSQVRIGSRPLAPLVIRLEVADLRS